MILNEITTILDHIAANSHSDLLKNGDRWSETKWTKEIKEAVAKLGRNHFEYQVAANSISSADFGEWLFDLCWIKYIHTPENHRVLQEVPLVLESEWGKKDSHKPVVDDFEKLLVSNSKFKVMIFQASNFNDAQKIITQLIQAMNCFNVCQENSNFLLSCFLQDESNRKFYHVKI